MKLFKLGGQEIMFHRVKCLGKIHGKKSGTALQLLSSRYLQIWCWIAKSADVQFPPSLYANWLLLRWSFMTRPTCLLYKALSRALAITGVTLIPRKSPFSLGTSTLGNRLVFALFQDSGQEWVDRERFHTQEITGVSSSYNRTEPPCLFYILTLYKLMLCSHADLTRWEKIPMESP